MSQLTHQSYTVFEAGPMQEWYARHSVQHPTMGEIKGKYWLKEDLRMTGMEMSVGFLPAGEVVGFQHAHKQNEELYVFLSGTGEMLLDGQRVPTRPGTMIKVDPPVSRSWRNSGTEPLVFLVIQTQAGSLKQWTRTDGLITGGNPWE